MARKMGNEDAREDDWRDDPGGEALNEPVDLPGPALDASEGNEVRSGGKATDPVIDDADKWIWSHAVLVGILMDIARSERTIIWSCFNREYISNQEFSGGEGAR